MAARNLSDADAMERWGMKQTELMQCRLHKMDQIISFECGCLIFRDIWLSSYTSYPLWPW